MEQPSENVIEKPWVHSAESVLAFFQVSREQGLSGRRVADQRRRYGPNQLRQVKAKSAVQILLHQLKSLIVVLLGVAAVLSFAFHDWLDGFAIVGVIVINTAIGFFMELKAVRSMEALHRLERITAKVRRDGQVQEVAAHDLVPGDIVLLEGGDLVSADMRLLTAAKLQVDESALTGESVPVSKQTDPIEEQAVLGDRTNMLFKGTAVTRGSAEAVVTATGMQTEFGRIAEMVQQAEEEITPLEKRLDRLGRNLIWVTLVLIVIVGGTGILRGKEVLGMIETAIALAVAAIPEGLPIVATLALARGMLRMARRNAMVNHLAAVETLGGVSVICTDKTGTLTENKMTVTALYLAEGAVTISPADEQGRGRFEAGGRAVDPLSRPVLKRALEVCVLCNNASIQQKEDGSWVGVGDPMEVALLAAARKAGLDEKEINARFPEEREEAFDSESKKMATFNRADDRYRVAVKGALEEVLKVCSQEATADGFRPLDEQRRAYWSQTNLHLAEQGYRLLALAEKQVESLTAAAYENLCFLGLLCMADPPREDVKPAVADCRKAGIQVVMITGDHPKTAASIASAIGLTDNRDAPVVVGKDIKPAEEMTEEDRRHYRQSLIFARVSPRQKLDLIAVHQQTGSVVAMTGDGVNDAPALQKADIGIAMGQRGTQVAKEAADMVLKDDAFSTIVAAVEQGRIIFENIRKFVVYLLSCNISEVMVVFAASIINAPMPILPLQILFLNLVTDVFPALALGAGRGHRRIMSGPPRPSDEPILPLRSWFTISGYGLLLSASVMVSFVLAFRWLGLDQERAVTVSFLTLATAQLWHVFNMRQRKTGLLDNEIVKNPYVWAALGLCTVLLLAAVYLPGFSRILHLTHPGPGGWGLVLGAGFLTCLLGQMIKAGAAGVERVSGR